MSTQERQNKLNDAIADACRRLEDGAKEEKQPGPKPGHLYVFPMTVDAAVEWLVVRAHPDEDASLLVVPVDDFPFAGAADVTLKPDFTERPTFARCGLSAWIPAAACQDARRLGRLSLDAVTAVRKRLADLARGRFENLSAVDHDPAYLSWIEEVAVAREQVMKQA